MKRVWQRNLLLCTFTVCMVSILLCFHAIAYAHAYIVKSVPVANQSLESMPKMVQIWFDEPVQAVFSSMTVTGENGERMDQGDAQIASNNPDLLECDLKPGVQAGLYTVNWHVISADGHPVQGVIPFHVGITNTNTGIYQVASRGYLPGFDMVLIRWGEYLSMLGYFGILVFRLFILPKKLSNNPDVQSRFSRALWIAWAGIAIFALLSLPLQTKIDANVTWSQAIHPQFLRTVISLTRFGHLWIIQVEIVLVLFFLASLMMKGLKHWIYYLAGLLTIGLFMTKAMAGHAVSTMHPVVSITADVFHLMAASVWIGSLLGFVLLIPPSFRSGTDVEDRQLYWSSIHRFSPWGIISVLTLMLTGLYAAMQQIPTVYALLHTTYGHTLVVKICIFLCMFGFAVYHWINGRIGARKTRRNIHKTIWIEFGLGTVILIVTSILTNLPPALSNPGPVFQMKTVTNGERASLSITPNTAGENSFALELKDKLGRPVTDLQQVTLSFTQLDMNMGTETVRLLPAKPGQYTVRGLYLAMEGHWDVHLHLLTNSFQDLDTDFKIVVGSPDGE